MYSSKNQMQCSVALRHWLSLLTKPENQWNSRTSSRKIIVLQHVVRFLSHWSVQEKTTKMGKVAKGKTSKWIVYHLCRLTEKNALCVFVTEHCKDFNNKCEYWASIGECNRNPGYMRVYCKRSCQVCPAQGKKMFVVKCFHRASMDHIEVNF